MVYDPDVHHRRSIRLKGYDYATAGAYFITICIQQREHLLGHIEDSRMILNDAGRMVAEWLHKLPGKYCGVSMISFCVMPNHVHFIVGIMMSDDKGEHIPVGADPCVCPGNDMPGNDNTGIQGAHAGAPLRTETPDVPEIIQWFKTMTTNEYIQSVKQNHWAPFNKRLWQRNYYERIVRDDKELHDLCEYIENNPARWEDDENNLRTTREN